MDVCRLCSEKENLIDVFNQELLTAPAQLRRQIQLATGIEIRKSDEVSKLVCNKCCILAVKLYKYRCCAIGNDKILKEQAGLTLPVTRVDQEIVKLNQKLSTSLKKGKTKDSSESDKQELLRNNKTSPTVELIEILNQFDSKDGSGSNVEIWKSSNVPTNVRKEKLSAASEATEEKIPVRLVISSSRLTGARNSPKSDSSSFPRKRKPRMHRTVATLMEKYNHIDMPKKFLKSNFNPVVKITVDRQLAWFALRRRKGDYMINIDEKGTISYRRRDYAEYLRSAVVPAGSSSDFPSTSQLLPAATAEMGGKLLLTAQNTSKVLMCAICQMVCSDEAELDQHEKSHLQCKFCKKRVVSMNRLNQHLKRGSCVRRAEKRTRIESPSMDQPDLLTLDPDGTIVANDETSNSTNKPEKKPKSDAKKKDSQSNVTASEIETVKAFFKMYTPKENTAPKKQQQFVPEETDIKYTHNHLTIIGKLFEQLYKQKIPVEFGISWRMMGKFKNGHSPKPAKCLEMWDNGHVIDIKRDTGKQGVPMMGNNEIMNKEGNNENPQNATVKSLHERADNRPDHPFLERSSGIFFPPQSDPLPLTTTASNPIPPDPVVVSTAPFASVAPAIPPHSLPAPVIPPVSTVPSLSTVAPLPFATPPSSVAPLSSVSAPSTVHPLPPLTALPPLPALPPPPGIPHFSPVPPFSATAPFSGTPPLPIASPIATAPSAPIVVENVENNLGSDDPNPGGTLRIKNIWEINKSAVTSKF